MVKVPTVAIANDEDSDYVVINQSDYNPEVHTLWKDREPEPNLHSYPAIDLEESEPVADVDQPEVIESDAQADVDQPEAIEPDQDAELTARAEELADQKTMTELKSMAKELGISGYSKMNQADITMAIARAEADGSD